ncbi:MAG: hypothetical protein DMG97_29250 [Acidobacteria bacterium]|nr:MAG: hypothetical protein DMG97_29250 [Acidobacteriota bacterium]
MSPLVWMLIVWGVLTSVLIVLLIYRSTLTMQEDDQLFLGDSESHMEQEQIQLMHKVNKINRFRTANPGHSRPGYLSGTESSAVKFARACARVRILEQARENPCARFCEPRRKPRCSRQTWHGAGAGSGT